MKWVILALGLLGCSSSCEPPSEPDAPVVPPVPPPPPARDCEAAGARLEALDCRRPDGEPWWLTPGGAPYADACQDAAQKGRDWHPECVSTIERCEDFEAAFDGKVCNP